jgi:hypothetical protein
MFTKPICAQLHADLAAVISLNCLNDAPRGSAAQTSRMPHFHPYSSS